MANWDFDYDQGIEREFCKKLDVITEPLHKKIEKLENKLKKITKERDNLRLKLDSALEKLHKLAIKRFYGE